MTAQNVQRTPAGADAVPSCTPEEQILHSAPDAVLTLDDRGFVTYANPAIERLLGSRPEEIVGRPVAVLLSDPVELRRLNASLASDQQHFDQDLTLRHADGSCIHTSASLGPLSAQGDARSSVLVLRDVTRQRRIEGELGHKNEELEHCVHALAHDLRSPLVALLGFSRLLRQDYGSLLDESGTHFLDRIEQAGRTMEDLIHDLLELSRIGQGGEKSALVDPRSVLQQLAAEFKGRLDAGDITLELPEDPPMVYCDRTRLYQLFCNLIGNAIEHMGPCECRRIAVDVRPSQKGCHISVRDWGRGVPHEHQDRIFDVFQSFGARSGERRGSGIGLAVVRKIAETHGGRAWVESEPERGSTFHIDLPGS